MRYILERYEKLSSLTPTYEGGPHPTGCGKGTLTMPTGSSPRITYKEHTSSTSIPPSESFSLPSWAGSLDTMGISCSTILAIHTSPIEYPTSPSVPCQPSLDP